MIRLSLFTTEVKTALIDVVRFFVFSSFYVWISAHNLSEIIGEITLNINQPLNTKKLAIFVMDKEPLNSNFYTFWYWFVVIHFTQSSQHLLI